MSEFSESYHLRTKDTEEAVNLIKKSGIKGFVFKEENGWVSFVVDGSEFKPNKKILSKNEGIIVHYANAENYGFFISIYHRSKLVSHYELIFWDEEIYNDSPNIKDEELDISIMYQLIKQNINEISLEELTALLYPDNLENTYDNKFVIRLANLIGLTNYSWISYHYLSNAFEKKELENEIKLINF